MRKENREEKAKTDLTFSTRIDIELFNWLTDYAKRQNTSKSQVIKDSLTQLLDEDDKGTIVQLKTLTLGIKALAIQAHATVTRQCEICQEKFERKRRGQRFCSPACRNQYKTAYNRLYTKYIQAPQKKGERPKKSLEQIRVEALELAQTERIG